MQTYQATLNDLDDVAQLFESYRQFYKKPANPQEATDFIEQRLELHDSVIFICRLDDNKAVGFVQLYPTFSSTNLEKMYILNDLYVDPTYRRLKVGKALMEHAEQFGIKTKAHSLKLCTAVDNHQAQALYRQMGYRLIDSFDHYILTL
jgi:ribosomal protein S18 acetylase RimI-like enzyme